MCLLAAIVSAAVCGAFAGPALADELSEAQEALTQAETRLAQLSQEAETLKAEAAALQEEIDVTLEHVLETQRAMLEGQQELGRSVNYSYKTGSAGFLDVLFCSGSISELFQNLVYMQSIQESQAAEIEAQKRRKAEFDVALAELNEKKDQQEAKLKELDDARAEAQNVVDSAAVKVTQIEDEREAERLAALQAQADAMEQQKEQTSVNPGTDEGWNTNPGGSSGGNDTGGEGSGDGGSGSGGGNTPTDPGSGWQTGVASAYGGSTDSYTPNPGTTATGAVCDDNSVGVAIPMSWPNYWTYYGRSVEICYGGKTVVAVVNDCGVMDGGSRSLDLQPGIWKQFGFSSCQAWGLRTVSYRFI